jgi:hypothetical protein
VTISVLDAVSAWIMTPPEGGLLAICCMPPCGIAATAGAEVSPLITERRVCASLPASEFLSGTTWMLPGTLAAPSSLETSSLTRAMRPGLSERSSRPLVRLSASSTKRWLSSPPVCGAAASGISLLMMLARSTAEACLTGISSGASALGWSMDSISFSMRRTLLA